MSKSLSKVHWETVIKFNWGVDVKTTYPTRAAARAGMKISKENHKAGREDLPDYITFELYKVTHLAGLSKLTDNGVFIYEKAR